MAERSRLSLASIDRRRQGGEQDLGENEMDLVCNARLKGGDELGVFGARLLPQELPFRALLVRARRPYAMALFHCREDIVPSLFLNS